MVKPPGTGGRTGQGLMIASCPASVSAASICPVPLAGVGQYLQLVRFAGEQAGADGGLGGVPAGGRTVSKNSVPVRRRTVEA